MAKEKNKTGVPNKHLHARISYLQQVATYLTTQSGQQLSIEAAAGFGDRNLDTDSLQALDDKAKFVTKCDENYCSERTGAPDAGSSGQSFFHSPSSGGLSLYLSTHLQQVAQKSQIRLHTNVKHSICKTCSTILVDGGTCTKYMENLSRGGKKPHATVLVAKCGVCGAKKRFPVGAKKQMRKAERVKAA